MHQLRTHIDNLGERRQENIMQNYKNTNPDINKCDLGCVSVGMCAHTYYFKLPSEHSKTFIPKNGYSLNSKYHILNKAICLCHMLRNHLTLSWLSLFL